MNVYLANASMENAQAVPAILIALQTNTAQMENANKTFVSREHLTAKTEMFTAVQMTVRQKQNLLNVVINHVTYQKEDVMTHAAMNVHQAKRLVKETATRHAETMIPTTVQNGLL